MEYLRTRITCRKSVIKFWAVIENRKPTEKELKTAYRITKMLKPCEYDAV